MALSANRVTSEGLRLGLHIRIWGDTVQPVKGCNQGCVWVATWERLQTKTRSEGTTLEIPPPCRSVSRCTTHVHTSVCMRVLCACVPRVFKWRWGAPLNHTEPLCESFLFLFLGIFQGESLSWCWWVAHTSLAFANSVGG